MKKVLLFAVVAVSIGFTSCKKDFKCVCTENGQTVVEAEIANSRRPEAATACKLVSTGTDVDCKLK